LGGGIEDRGEEKIDGKRRIEEYSIRYNMYNI